MEAIKKDARFTHISKDPRFRTLRRKDRKVKIDQRFKGMFSDKKFKVKYTVDKRGRPINATTNENLKRFYDLESSEEESGDDDESEESKGGKLKVSLNVKEQDEEEEDDSGDLDDDEDKVDEDDQDDQDDDEDDQDDDEDDQDDDVAKSGSEVTEDEDESGEGFDFATGPDIARGEGDLSSSDDDDDEYYGSESEEEIPWSEMDRDAPEATEESHRLAVCNMDWDSIKARDLMVLLNSFTPTGGIIKSVTIYPSEFGLERMKEEETKGPRELVTACTEANKAVENEEHMRNLRKYQLNRLKYYYAVVDCDSKVTASRIYEECDGMEYEGSSNKIDLRYIPDDMSFEDQEIKSQECDAPDSSTYKPSSFLTSALQQSKVNLTWDETNRERLAVTMRKFTNEDLENLDIRDYLASDSDGAAEDYGDLVDPSSLAVEDEDEDEDAQIQKYRALLQGLPDTAGSSARAGKADQDDEDAVDMEITWEPGLESKDEKRKKGDLTPWEEYLEKKKEKKKKKKKDKKNKKQQEPAADEDGISDDDLPEGIDLDDPYFKEELDRMKGESEKSKKNTEKKEKKKKKKKMRGKEDEEDEDEETKKQKAELALLMMDEATDDKKHFNLKSIMEEDKPLKGKKKRRMRKMKASAEKKEKEVQDDFELDLKDDRFNDLYQNPLFNLDPTVPEFKKTKAVDSMINEKLRRRTEKKVNKKVADEVSQSPAKKLKRDKEADVNGISAAADTKTDPSLAILIKSVKAKTKTAQQKKKLLKKSV